MGQGYSTEEGKLKTERIYLLFSYLTDELTREAEPQPESMLNKASCIDGVFIKVAHHYSHFACQRRLPLTGMCFMILNNYSC